MSIARGDMKKAKVLKDLNLYHSCARFFIKVLADLEDSPDTFSIDI